MRCKESKLGRRIAIGLMSYKSLNTAFEYSSFAQDITQRPKSDTKYPLVIFFQAAAHSPYEITSPLVDSIQEFRGPIGAVQTKHGIPISEAFPRYSAIAHKTSIIRSLDCENTSHDATPLVGDRFDKQGSRLTGKGIPYTVLELPSSDVTHRSLNPDNSFMLKYDLEAGRFVPPKIEGTDRICGRRKLLRSLERGIDNNSSVRDFNRNRNLAFDILTGGEGINSLFDISEAQSKRYGSGPIGEATAIASNLARSGAGIVVVYNELKTEDGFGWDMHSNMKSRTEELAPPTDKALVALIEDSKRYGFVTTALTEHGRTPRVNSGGGRDHFNVGYFIGAGGNFREGEVIGSLDNKGDIASDPVSAREILPTMIKACGAELRPEQIHVSKIIT